MCVVYTQKTFEIYFVFFSYYLFIYDVLGILNVDGAYIVVILFSFLFHIYDVQRIINVDGAYIHVLNM